MKLRAVHLVLLILLAAELVLLIFGPQSRDHLPEISKAAASGHKTDWWDDAAMGVRYAAWISAGLIGGLLLTTKFWTRALSGSSIRNPKSEIRNHRWFWPALIAAAALCLALRLPLASKSLWWDEAWVIMQASHGKWTPDKKHEGQLKFTTHDWKRCAWYYQKPTNHAPMSLLQKASITAWQKLTGAKREEFSDLSARIPALLASCLAVILLGCLLRTWGRPGAGVVAALVLAIHPWHIRYGVDARAYALVVPLCICGMFAVTRILDAGGRKIWPWAWWGLTEFVWLWTYPNAVLDISALNICLAILLWRQQANQQDRWTAIFRLIATNVFAAICFIQMFLPNLMQARHWAGQEADKHVLNSNIAASTISQLLFGHEKVFPPGIGVIGTISNPLAWVFIVWIACLFYCLCHLSSENWQKHKQERWILGSIILSSLSFVLTTWLLGSYFYPRFVIALLPVLIAGLSLLLAMSRTHLLKWSFPMLVFVLCSYPAFESLLHRPIAPLHNVASFLHKEDYKNGHSIIVACYGLGREVLPVYYPKAIPVDNARDLQSLMQQALDSKKKMFVAYGYEAFNRATKPDGFVLLDDRHKFYVKEKLDGLESDFEFHILQFRSELLSTADGSP